MRLPNGFGSVTKLSGNRRRPYMVRKTTGFNEKGHPIYLPIGYTETREEGILMLAEYNKNPYDIEKAKITFKELYEKWTTTKKYKTMADNSKKSAKTAFNKCLALYDIPYREIKAYQMREVVDASGKYASQGAVKTLFKNLDLYALELDISEKKYSELITTDPVPETKKKPFTDKEIKLLWKNVDRPWVDTILIFIYSGFRLNELLGMETADVDLELGIFKGGIKTTSGKDRIVPIHSKIFKLVQRRVDEGNKYLFSNEGKKCSEYYYYKYWNSIMNEMKFEHTPHESRHTFRSKLDSAGANKVSIDLLMGHKSTDIGERVYTHKTMEELREAIEMIN